MIEKDGSGRWFVPASPTRRAGPVSTLSPARLIVWALLGGAALGGCRATEAKQEERKERLEEVGAGMKAWLTERIDAWQRAARELADAAPAPPDRGWDPELDGPALAQMKRAWLTGRDAYEHIEGAIAPTFPESDTATDARYDDFLLQLGPVGDPRPFDDEGVVGMHAIERVLWANSIPEVVVDFERGLPGYRPARFPETAEEAAEFKEKLAGRLTRDIAALLREFEPLVLDVSFSFQGLIDLSVEQAEKVDRAATGQEESRYAQTTMRDLRANHRGCLEAYRIFQPWVRSAPGGPALDAEVLTAFDRLRIAYEAVSGDAIPKPPAGWSSVKPRAEHAETPFGRLFHTVKRESDPSVEGSLTERLYAIAKLLELDGVVVR